MCVNFPNSMQILIHRSAFMYRLLVFASKNTHYMVVLSKTKDIEDKILNLCYPWVFTHGCQTSGSPRNTGNLAEWKNFLVLYNMYGSIEYQLFSYNYSSYLAHNK